MVAEDMNATIKTNVLYIINYIVIIKFIGFKNSKTSIRQSSIHQEQLAAIPNPNKIVGTVPL